MVYHWEAYASNQLTNALVNHQILLVFEVWNGVWKENLKWICVIGIHGQKRIVNDRVQEYSLKNERKREGKVENL